MKPPGEKQRDGLGNIFSKLQRGGELKVGYFGASVTNGAGATSQDKKWRWIVHHWLEEQYPQAKLAHLHVVNGGTGSDLGACRIGREMLSQDPDLLFIEFAVNDGGRPQGYVLRTMEGIIRQIWRAGAGRRRKTAFHRQDIKILPLSAMEILSWKREVDPDLICENRLLAQSHNDDRRNNP